METLTKFAMLLITLIITAIVTGCITDAKYKVKKFKSNKAKCVCYLLIGLLFMIESYAVGYTIFCIWSI